MWDPAVRFFRVYKDGNLAAYLYFDPYARSAGARCALPSMRPSDRNVCSDFAALPYCQHHSGSRKSHRILGGVGTVVFLTMLVFIRPPGDALELQETSFALLTPGAEPLPC